MVGCASPRNRLMRSIQSPRGSRQDGHPLGGGSAADCPPRSIAEGERGTRNCGECHQARKIDLLACDWALYSLLLPARSTPMFYAVPRIAWGYSLLPVLVGKHTHSTKSGSNRVSGCELSSTCASPAPASRVGPTADRGRRATAKVYGIGIRERHSVRVSELASDGGGVL